MGRGGSGKLLNFLDNLYASIQMNPDHLIWNACNSKEYSVSSMYNLSLTSTPSSDINSRKSFVWIWKNVAPYKIQCFIWMVKLGKLKNVAFLLRIGTAHRQDQAVCKFCGIELESINHSLLLCSHVWNV